MTTLVTGAGLIGTALVQKLVATDHDVRVFDFAPPPDRPSAAYVRGDLRDPEAVRGAVEGVDQIIHTAALHTIHHDSFSNKEFLDINVTGTYNLLEAAVECGVRRVVHCSTLGVITGVSWPASSPAVALTDGDVDHHRAAGTLYSLTKLFNEHTLAYFHTRFGLDVVGLRYGVIWELARTLFPDKLVEHAIGGLVTGLDDAVESQLAALSHPGPLPRLTYSVVSQPLLAAGDVNALSDLREALIDRYPALADALPGPLPRMFVVDLSRTERDLGIAIRGTSDAFLREALGAGATVGRGV